jgi:hypothetical protein
MTTAAEGKLVEMRLEDGGRARLVGRIACPARLCPAPGQYLLASRRVEPGEQEPGEAEIGEVAIGEVAVDEVDTLPAVLFPSDYFPGGFETAPGLPRTWTPGAKLALRGPLGRGFALNGSQRRVALAALGDGPHRLMPLLRTALARQADVLLYCAAVPPGLPRAVEVAPLDQLGESLAWADVLAVDLPLAKLAELPARLGLSRGQQPPCAVEVLITTPMPCAGQAECGVCAVPARRGAGTERVDWLLACKDGPVFEWKDLAL